MTSDYDAYYASFSADGTLKMIEHALEPTNTTTPLVALRTEEGVFIAVKREPKEILEMPVQRNIVKINENCYMGTTGMLGDIDQVINLTREIANDGFDDFGFEPTPDIIARQLADNRQRLIMQTGERAFSFTSVLFGIESEGNVEEKEVHLWHTDTSAVLYSYFAIALGQSNLKMTKYLEKNYKKDLGDEQALMVAIQALSESIGKDFSPHFIDVAYLKKDEKLKFLTVDEIDGLLQKISENE